MTSPNAPATISFNHANDFYNYTVGPQEIAAQYPCQGYIVTPYNGTMSKPRRGK